MITETVYYICRICNEPITKSNLSNSGMLNRTCKRCIPIRNNKITDKYDELRKTMKQFEALDVLAFEYNLTLETLMNLITKTKRERKHHNANRSKIQNTLQS